MDEHNEKSVPTFEQKTQMLQYAADVRKFEIELFWKRSLFFWGFIGAAIVAYSVMKSTDFESSLAVACFGFLCSVAWTLANRGSKYWHEAWEQKLLRLEKDVLGGQLFSEVESLKSGHLWGARRYSVSKLAIALSDFVVLVWLFLAIKVSPLQTGNWNFIVLGEIMVTAIFLLMMLIFARSTRY